MVVAALCAASWLLAPKGENRVYVPLTEDPAHADNADSSSPSRLWRSSLILAIVSCYLMWLIAFLAQLNPLIAPRRSDLREQYLE